MTTAAASKAGENLGDTSRVSSARLWWIHRGLILLILASALQASRSASASVATSKPVNGTPCGSQPAFQELILHGGDGQLGYAKRKIAYQRALELCPSQLDAYHLLSLLVLQHRDFEEALRWTRRGLAVAPDNPRLKLDEALSLLSEGHAEESLTILNRLPSFALGQFYLGMAYRALGEHKPAQQAFLNALSLRVPGSVRSLCADRTRSRLT